MAGGVATTSATGLPKEREPIEPKVIVQGGKTLFLLAVVMSYSSQLVEPVPPVSADRPPEPSIASRERLAARYREVRAFTEKLAEPLLPEDCVVQSMMDVSPTKWHLAHTSWFFETFILQAALPGYRSHVPEYGFLFNSYYNAVGPMHARDRRGLISRPGLKETRRYRAYVDRQMAKFFKEATPGQWETFESRIELGLHHEQQHQELILTDIKHVFAQNPLHPVYQRRAAIQDTRMAPLEWVSFPEGLAWIGHDGEGFAFDNEGPRHREFVEPFQIASRLVTNREYLEFIEAGGYQRPEFWLSAGWMAVKEGGWTAPLYWQQREGNWFLFTLSGLRPVDGAEPVCHVSFYEADAYARWAGARLPTEAEWEIAAGEVPLAGNFVEQGALHPAPVAPGASEPLPAQMFGDVWEWTRSAYAPYPGYAPVRGALGEYNGKFMCNQMVLRGGSSATAQSHIRRTYRNFFAPEKRWQFNGIRLARDGYAG